MNPLYYKGASPFKVDSGLKPKGSKFTTKFKMKSTTLRGNQPLKSGQSMDSGQNLKAKQAMSTKGVNLAPPKGKSDAVVGRYASIKLDKQAMELERPKKNWLGPRNRNARILM